MFYHIFYTLQTLTKSTLIDNVQMFLTTLAKKRASKNQKLLETLINTGADNKTRTYDLLITNEPLYQLSYAGMTT